MCWGHLHALLLCVLGAVCAVEELPLEKLHCDDGKDEHEELVDNEYVEDILQGGDHTVKHSLRGGVKPLERPVRLPGARLGPHHHQPAPPRQPQEILPYEGGGMPIGFRAGFPDGHDSKDLPPGKGTHAPSLKANPKQWRLGGTRQWAESSVGLQQEYAIQGEACKCTAGRDL